MRLSLTHTLFAITALIALILAGFIMLYSRHTSREQAVIAAEAMMEDAVDIVLLQTAALITPVEQVVALSRYWPDVAPALAESTHPLRARFVGILDQVPQVSAIAVGYDSGAYYAMLPASRHPTPAALHEGAALVEVAVVQPSLGGTVSILDHDGDLLQTLPFDDTTYDPRERPWFDIANDATGVVRTAFFESASDNVVGYALAQRQGDRVFAAQITLEGLEAFLDTVLQADDALLAIIDSRGSLLAGSQRAGQLSPDNFVRAAQATFDSKTIELNGDAMMYRRVPIDLGGGFPETLVAILPVASVTGPIDRVTTETAGVSFALLLASIPLIWLVASRMSKPLLRLVDDAERIRAFQLEAKPRDPSHVREIARLERAVGMMREGLSTFTVYVPKALVKRLVERGEPPHIGGTRQDLTVMFLDLENFTNMAAGLDADELMNRMSAYFEIVTDVLLEHDATIDKFIGDAVMAFWNAPDVTPDHPAKACDAALAIRARTLALTDGWSAGGGLRLRTRIGINCGPAVVGNVGSSDRMNYTALGATVNLASRLENLNRMLGTDILISRALHDRIGNQFVTTPKGAQAIKGYDDPIEVFALGERS